MSALNPISESAPIRETVSTQVPSAGRATPLRSRRLGRSRTGAAILLVAGLLLPCATAATGKPARADVEVVEVFLHIVRSEVELEDQGSSVRWQGDALLGLSELMANVNAVLGSEPFAPGLYSDLRLILAEGSFVTVEEGGVRRDVPLFVPSGGQTGLKLNQAFEVVEGKRVQLEVTFDPSALRHQPGRNRYMLRPTCLTIVDVQELDAVARVGEEGGVLTTLDGRVELTVPPGALDHRETLSIRRLDEAETPPPTPLGPHTSDRLEAVGPAYDLLAASGLTFAVPVTLSTSYTEAEIEDLEVPHLGLHVYDEASARWQRLPTTHDLEARRTQAELTHLSIYRNLVNTSGLVLGPESRVRVNSSLQQSGTFDPTAHVGLIGIGVVESPFCSGFLISNNLFMTTYGCGAGCERFPNGTLVTFGLIEDPENAPQVGGPYHFRCSEIELALPHLDVAVVELSPDAATGLSAGEVWGYFTLDPTRPATRAYMAGFPADLQPPHAWTHMWLDASPDCAARWPDELWNAWGWDQTTTLLHGCDASRGNAGSPLVDFEDRNRVVGIHRSGLAAFFWAPFGPPPAFLVSNLATPTASVIPFDDLNGNQVLDMVEIDLTGSLTDVGFRTCVPELDGPCILRWFLPYRIDFAAVGGVPPYVWSASGLPGGATMSSAGVLEGPPPFCLCDFSFQVTVTDSLGATTTRTVLLRSGL